MARWHNLLINCWARPTQETDLRRVHGAFQTLLAKHHGAAGSINCFLPGSEPADHLTRAEGLKHLKVPENVGLAAALVVEGPGEGLKRMRVNLTSLVQAAGNPSLVRLFPNLAEAALWLAPTLTADHDVPYTTEELKSVVGDLRRQLTDGARSTA